MNMPQQTFKNIYKKDICFYKRWSNTVYDGSRPYKLFVSESWFYCVSSEYVAERRDTYSKKILKMGLVTSKGAL